jgi:multidrug efflux pump subunit AcrA (membrane-fusion protein)
VHGEGAACYVFAVRDGMLERRAVSLGRGIAGDVEVIAGVNVGDELVVNGPENLRDREKVATRARE